MWPDLAEYDPQDLREVPGLKMPDGSPARLYSGFRLDDPHFSVSMTINAPSPILLAMYVASAKRRLGSRVLARLRGTTQADIFKEVQAQNEIIFPLQASLRFLGDTIAFTTEHMPRWYPISISGYHIAEAGATPVQQAAYTLSNGFTYVELFQQRGMKLETFGPRLSFFLDCGLDIEYLALARVCRKIWAIGMKQIFNAGHKAQMFKLHTQTSGRSLIAAEFRNNVVRTAAELMIAYMNATNSSHSNSADEPFTTPSEDYVRLAAHSQAILLEESGFFKHMMNTFGGAHGMAEVERQVEKAILDEFREIDRLGGVLRAVEHRYQRSQIQHSAHRMEQQIYNGTRPVIGLNRLWNENDRLEEVEMVRTPRKQKELQVARLGDFKRRNADKAPRALERLTACVESGGNTFAELIEAVEVCSLGRITDCLHETVGHFRPTV
jgi:methylmalonyl-CoA mutase